MLLIKNAHLLTPQEQVPQGGVLIEHDKIMAAGPLESLELPPACPEFDAAGLTAAPGYIDLQLNGGFGEDFTQNPASIWQVAAALPRYGVTSFLPTIITSPAQAVQAALAAWRSAPPQPETPRANALGLHLEGPMINPAKKGAHNPRYICLPNLEVIEGWSADSGVLLVTLAPELPGAAEVIAALARRGVLVSAGHSMASLEEAAAGFAAGVRMGTHLFNAQPPLDHRQPGLAGALLTEAGVTAGIIPDGIHVHPAMLRLAWSAKGAAGLAIVTDAMAALGMPPGEYWLGDFNVLVDASSARLANGTLAGSTLTMDAAVRNMAAFCGCSLAEAISMATLTPARLLGLANKGQLRPGADADLVLLDAAGQVQATFIGGELAYAHPQFVSSHPIPR